MIATDQQADAALDAIERQIDRAARDAFAGVVRAIKDGGDARAALAYAFESFVGEYADRMAEAFGKLLGEGFTRRDVLDMPVGDLTLSSRLFGHADRVAAEVTAIVRNHVQGVQQARELALALYDGYEPRDAPPRPLNGVARVKLPKALRALTSDLTVRRPLQATIDRGLAQARRLKTSALRAAYVEALTAWENGAADAALGRKLDTAIREKTRYYANRIAQTELASAHQKAVGRELMADPTVTVVQVLINPTHPRTDICDLHARANLWGLGPGCYPKDKAPRPTYHPFCRCKLRSRPSLDAANAVPAKGGEAAYLAGLDESEAAAVMGSKDKARRVLEGEPFEAVINDGVQPAFRLVRLGDDPTPAPRRVRPARGRSAPSPSLPAPAPAPAPVPRDPVTVEDFIAEGRALMARLPALPAVSEDIGTADARAWHAALVDALTAAGRMGGKLAFDVDRGPLTIRGVRAVVEAAAAMYPPGWVAFAEKAGKLTARGSRTRCWAWTAKKDYDTGVAFRDWTVRKAVKQGEGFLTVRDGDLSVAIHEFGHRLQETVPGLDKLFQELHRRRVAADPVRRICDLPGYQHYAPNEVTREDNYRNAYQGREYSTTGNGSGMVALDGGALEVLTMAFESVLGGVAPCNRTQSGLASAMRLADMLRFDREMVEFTLGVLLRFNP